MTERDTAADRKAPPSRIASPRRDGRNRPPARARRQDRHALDLRYSRHGGGLIGLANLVWLYLAYYLGLHTGGIVVFQGFMLVWLLLTIAGFILMLRAVKRRNPTLGYLGGLGAGAVASVVSAIVAVVAQVGYYKIVHPAWPEFMAGQTREHFTAQGMAPDQVERMVEQARGSFTLANYAVASAATALILGVVLSAIIMIFLRRKAESADA